MPEERVAPPLDQSSSTPAADPPPARTALVTGASRGIGRELVEGLAASGVAVGLLGRDAEALESVRAALPPGAGSVVVVADVTDGAAVERAVREVERQLGGVDLLVNNAGRIEPVEVPLWEADPAEWWGVVEADLRGPFLCSRAVVPGMLRRGGGRVVELASGASTRDNDVYSAYYAAKTGVVRLAGALHAAGAERGLRAFSVAPGVVRTGMTRGMAVHADREDWTPPEAVVDLVLAVARGELDAWSGRFLRAGADRVEVLASRRPVGRDRTLGVHAWGPDDPLA